MEIVGMISGGKDSIYNLMCAAREGHRIVALANLRPPDEAGQSEIDSYMYQSVGHSGIETIAEAMELPLYRRQIRGKPVNVEFEYQKTDGDEVEDLYELLSEVKRDFPNLKGVSAGAILSSYQKKRVEDVCSRLNLIPVCYLWERDQKELLNEMIENQIEAIIIKVASIGLKECHLGMTIREIAPIVFDLNAKFDVHPCGEGGEYETFVLDCPLFKRKIAVREKEVIKHTDDAISPVYYLNLLKLDLIEKKS
ncbi:hypothetical protein WR25_13248 [Diploscapter pachys]|uniref:Diphthine--ammonia ligase n=1 Tax=Diploscapter pachys TaxID=2018661 RepID=A0A2A2LWN2_9BILA|nr:hypothetical protein WR25_13248 [Diploscapter pachys]